MKSNRFLQLPYSTILVVASCVVLPWGLIAIPGEFAQANVSGSCCVAEIEHGWPAVQLVSRLGTFDRLPLGPPPTKAQAEQKLREMMMGSSKGWNFETANAIIGSRVLLVVDKDRFWSDKHRWPWVAGYQPKVMSYRWQVRWFGLFINVSILLASCYVVALICEHRRRSIGRLLRLKLRDLVVFMTFTVIALSILAHRYRQARSDYEASAYLSRHFIGHDIEYENVLPVFLHRLIDYSTPKIGDVRLFRRATNGVVEINAAVPNDEFERRDLCIACERLPITEIKADVYTRQLQDFLHEYDASRLESLSARQNALSDTAFDFSFVDRMPRLTSLQLSLKLQSQAVSPQSVDWQVEVLSPLKRMPALRKLRVEGIDDYGVAVIADMTNLSQFGFSSAAYLPDGLSEKSLREAMLDRSR